MLYIYPPHHDKSSGRLPVPEKMQPLSFNLGADTSSLVDVDLMVVEAVSTPHFEQQCLFNPHFLKIFMAHM